MKEQRLEELFIRYINRTATEAEESELMLLMVDSELTNKKEALIENCLLLEVFICFS